MRGGYTSYECERVAHAHYEYTQSRGNGHPHAVVFALQYTLRHNYSPCLRDRLQRFWSGRERLWSGRVLRNLCMSRRAWVVESQSTFAWDDIVATTTTVKFQTFTPSQVLGIATVRLFVLDSKNVFGTCSWLEFLWAFEIRRWSPQFPSGLPLRSMSKRPMSNMRTA